MSGWNSKLGGDTYDTSECIHRLEFPTSQACWEGVNELFLRNDPDLFKKGAIAMSGCSCVYNVWIYVKKLWMDPEFDFGRLFNYTKSKWITLLNNYVDMNQLDLIRSQIRSMKKKYSQNYNIPFQFTNTHNNGKQCLLSLIFSKRYQSADPLITITLRASEITKRLAFDLLLVQRIAEYVYGDDVSVQLVIFANQMYGNTETLIMYDTHKPIKKILKGLPESAWLAHVKSVYKKYMEGEEKDFFNFKVYYRSFKVLRPDLYSHLYKKLLAKDLLIEEDDTVYPPEVITLTQRKRYKAKLLKQLKNGKSESKSESSK